MQKCIGNFKAHWAKAMLFIRNTAILDNELTLAKLVAQHLPIVSPLLQTNHYRSHYKVSCDLGWNRKKTGTVTFPTPESTRNTKIEFLKFSEERYLVRDLIV